MSFILKLNNEQIAVSGGWNPSLFGEKTNTSFPASVNQTYVWEHDGFDLRWVDDPPPAEPTEKQIAAQVREQRDQLLTESDWTQVADAPVDKIAWAAYRKELRDIPDQAGFPWVIQWPSVPG